MSVIQYRQGNDLTNRETAMTHTKLTTLALTALLMLGTGCASSTHGTRVDPAASVYGKAFAACLDGTATVKECRVVALRAAGGQPAAPDGYAAPQRAPRRAGDGIILTHRVDGVTYTSLCSVGARSARCYDWGKR